MKIEGSSRFFQWSLSLLLVLAIIHIVSFVGLRPVTSSFVRRVELETISDDGNKRYDITTNTIIGDEEFKSYTISALNREEQCLQAFLSGAEPRSTKRQQMRISPTLQNNWSDNDCDELVCTNAADKDTTTKEDSVDGDDDEPSSCQWSQFAIETLIPKQREHEACDEAHVNEFYVDPQWETYAFSDYFRGIMFRKSRTAGTSWEDFNKTVPAGSLMEDYHKASVQQGTGPNDFALLRKIINKRKAQLPHDLLPQPNTLLIHLRLGDTIDCAVDSVPELLFQQCYYYRGNVSSPATRSNDLCRNPGVKKPNDEPLLTAWNAYVLPLSHYSQLLRRQDVLRRYKSIVIMGSAHQAEMMMYPYTRNATKSCLYTVALRNYLERFFVNNTSVTMRLAHPPDDDIIFASQVDGFVQGGGGYSRLLARLVKESGGTVYSV
jgi:hypothetical protein